ncbi:uncharacterized protein TNCV_4340861 [Trichonephila clavipes]|nr:uncharacterized protein TNCV_4340861 [Trichonephila clavipes]
MDHLNHCQVTWTTTELAPPPLTATPHQREDVSAFDRFNVHRCPTRRVFSGTGLELVTSQATRQNILPSTLSHPWVRSIALILTTNGVVILEMSRTDYEQTLSYV